MVQLKAKNAYLPTLTLEKESAHKSDAHIKQVCKITRQDVLNCTPRFDGTPWCVGCAHLSACFEITSSCVSKHTFPFSRQGVKNSTPSWWVWQHTLTHLWNTSWCVLQHTKIVNCILILYLTCLIYHL